MTYLSLKRVAPGVVLALAMSASFAQGTTAIEKATAPAPTPAATPAQPAPVAKAARMERVADLQFRTLESDRTYRAALTRWLADAPGDGKKWKLSWELAEDDYEFAYEGEFGPELVKAVDGLCAALNASGIRARAYFYEGSRVVRLVMEGTPR